MRPRPLRHWHALLGGMPIVVAAATTGCAINGLGTIAARISHGHGALVYSSYAPGLSLRSWPGDAGASIGFTDRTCIAQLTTTSPPPGIYLLGLPAYPEHCYARDNATLGWELRITPPDLSSTLGYRSTTTLASVDVHDQVAYTVRYARAHPSDTILKVEHR